LCFRRPTVSYNWIRLYVFMRCYFMSFLLAN
jgi:hypothetical protein